MKKMMLSNATYLLLIVMMWTGTINGLGVRDDDDAKKKDFSVGIGPDQFVSVKTNAPALNDVTVEFYIRLDECSVQGIASQQLQMEKKDVPYTLRQQLPTASKALDNGLDKMASEQILTPGVTALRGAGLYKKGVNDTVVATELNNAGDYNIDEAVRAANENDASMAANMSEHVETIADPPMSGRGIMISPEGDLVIWSRDSLGIWRGISAASCESLKDAWHHVALVQQETRLIAYVDTEEAGRIIMDGHQGPMYQDVWTFGKFVQGPAFPASAALDRLRIWSRALSPEELVCALRGSAVSSSGLLANAAMDEGRGTVVVATPGMASVELVGSATESKWDDGAVSTGVPDVPKLPEERSCEAVAKEVSLMDPASPPPINELHLVSAAGSCPGDCSGNGRCNYETGVCFCFSGFVGLECQSKNYAGYALQFDSRASQHMTLLPMGKFRSITVTMWIKPTAIDGWRSLLHYVADDPSARPKGTMALELEDGKVRFLVNGNAPAQLLFNTALKQNEWQLMTVTYSMEHKGRSGTGSCSLYINGLLKETLSFEQSGPVFLGDGWFGGQKPFGRFFSGELDELRLWSRALSPMEVLTETSGRQRGTSSGLQAYYRFDEGSGRIAVDIAQDASSGMSDEEEDAVDDSKVEEEEGAAAKKALQSKAIPTRFDAFLDPSARPPQFLPSGAPMEPCPGKPSPCSSRGRCVNGKCKCINGYTGDACDVEACPGACSGHGLCVELDENAGTAALEALGVDVKTFLRTVEEEVSPSIANVVTGPINHIIEDQAKAGNAKTSVISTGSQLVANSTASLLGKTFASVFSAGGQKKGRCQCEEPYAPPSCASVRCPNDCSGHGVCSDSQCICEEGFAGHDCSKLVCTPSPNCNGNGDCIQGTCVCYAGWAGDGCGREETCPNDCSGHGACGRGGICKCDAKYSGRDCSWSVNCFNFCSGRGSCVMDKCVCEPQFAGDDCSRAACPGDCSGHGDCVGGVCLCEPGFTGEDCSQSSLWPLRCTTVRRGLESTTDCRRGWTNKPSSGAKVLDFRYATPDSELPTATIIEGKGE